MLIFFTIFVKGIPLVTVVNEQIGGDKYEPSSEAIVVQGTVRERTTTFAFNLNLIVYVLCYVEGICYSKRGEIPYDELWLCPVRYRGPKAK